MPTDGANDPLPYLLNDDDDDDLTEDGPTLDVVGFVVAVSVSGRSRRLTLAWRLFGPAEASERRFGSSSGLDLSTRSPTASSLMLSASGNCSLVVAVMGDHVCIGCGYGHNFDTIF